MSQKLLTGVLKPFASIFKTPAGGQPSPQLVDTTSPVQPVADVSRIAQRGFYADLVRVLPAYGPGVVTANVTPASYGSVVAANALNEVAIWVVSVGVFSQHAYVGNLTNAAVVWAPLKVWDLSTVPATPSNAGVPHTLAAFGAPIDTSLSFSAFGDAWSPLQPLLGSVQLPFLMEQDNLGNNIMMAGHFTSDGQVLFALRLYFGPKDGTPPGLA